MQKRNVQMQYFYVMTGHLIAVIFEGLRGIWEAPSSQERGGEDRELRSVNHFLSVWCMTMTV